MNSPLSDALQSFNRTYGFNYPFGIVKSPPEVSEEKEEKNLSESEKKEKEKKPEKRTVKRTAPEKADVPKGKRIYIEGRPLDEPAVIQISDYLGLDRIEKEEDQKQLGQLVEFAANKLKTTDSKKILRFLKKELRYLSGSVRKPHRQILAKWKIENA